MLASRPSLRLLTAALTLLTCSTGSLCLQAQPPQSTTTAADSADKDYSAELPRFAPKSTSEAAASFDVLPGFRVELIAAEPLVVDPVAFAFDARQRLFVVEMRDYSEQDTEHLGRIARLEDTDGDGRMDSRTTFVEGLSWPTAIWPWKDGVLVAEPPRITWYRDTDDDGQSDQQQDWFTGFGRDNVQGLVNSLRWGVDGYIHGATSSSGAEITQPTDADTAKVELRRRDFAIDPLTAQLIPETGGGQHGMSFNRWGDKFVTSNSDHLQQIIDLDWWTAQHTSSVPLPSPRRSIAEDGPQAEVYRTSPIEPWRIVRTRLRISGVAPGVVEGGGRAAGYFTGATGTWIMDREAGFGDPDHDTAIVCDVGSNLVHRKRMLDQGLFWSGQRIDQQTELLRSSDTWFRPVQLGDGPDGGLIIADMYREVIEHPKSLPPMIKRHLDLTSGRDRGRIWRLVPEGAERRAEPPPAALTNQELLARLAHPVAWQRRMASQLLLERGVEDVQSELLQTATQSDSPEAQVLAMHLASREQLFTAGLARQLLASPHPRVAQHALRLIQVNGLVPQIADELLRLAGQPTSPRVQLELALASGSSELSTADKQALLAKLLSTAKDPQVQAIVATSAGDSSWKLLDQTADQLPVETRAAWLKLLLPVWSRQIDQSPELKNWIASELTSGHADRQLGWFTALSQLSSAPQVAAILNALTAEQRQTLDEQVGELLNVALDDPAATAETFQFVRLLSPELHADWAEQLLEPTHPEAAQRAAIGLVGWSPASSIPDLVLSRFASLTPGLQADSLRGLSARKETTTLLANALENQTVKAGQIPLEMREQLLRSNDAQLAKRLEKLLGSVSADRQAVIDRYAPQLAETSTDQPATAGQEVFRKSCAQCHRLGELGNDVGPPLKQLADKSPQQLLEIILDPNREIDPKYASYTVLLVDGRVLSGIIQDETAGQVVIKEAGGTQHVIVRSDIEQIKNNGVSLMPVGLEENIDPAQMRQLIKFLKQSQ